MVEGLTDAKLRKMRRGGHDPEKVYAAYAAAAQHRGSPTVILAKTVKGWGLGEVGEGRNVTHQQKKLSERELRSFRDRFGIPIGDRELLETPFYRPPEDSEEMQYLLERRRALGGFVPRRVGAGAVTRSRTREALRRLLTESRESARSPRRWCSYACLRHLMNDPEIGRAIVPIVPDEARTFGMDALFRKYGIYSSAGQQYEPADSDVVAYYREAQDGQLLEEGITEAGSMASFTAAGTAYATHGVTTIPFFVFYSMFGFQRVGDLIWQNADARGRGFLIGATAGRTTLSGEGLQHQDGHSHVLASVVPTVRAYDPAFAYEIATIVREGIRRMWVEQEDVVYYLTVQNEMYAMPAMPAGVEEGISARHVSAGGRRGAAFVAAHPSVRQRRHPARRAASAAVACGARGRGRGVERDQLQRAAPRSPRRRALESAASDRAAAHAVREPRARRRAVARRGRRATYMKIVADQVARFVPVDVPIARHRRVRAQRGPPDPASVLRSGRRIRHGRRARRAGEKWPRRIPGSAAAAIADFGIDPDRADPASELDGLDPGKPESRGAAAMRVVVLQHESIEGPGVWMEALLEHAASASNACWCRRPAFHVTRGRRSADLDGRFDERQRSAPVDCKPKWGSSRNESVRALPVLGVCLGSQLIAKSAGGFVEPGPVFEIGFHEVELTDAGHADPVLRALPPRLSVLQWHGEYFHDVPGATVSRALVPIPHAGVPRRQRLRPALPSRSDAALRRRDV